MSSSSVTEPLARHRPPSASGSDGGPRKPKRPRNLSAQITVEGERVIVKATDPLFEAGLEVSKSQVLAAPEGVQAPQVSEHSLRIMTFRCEMCKNEVPQYAATKKSANRLWRRVQRALNNDGQTTMAHERVICTACAGPDSMPPRNYLQHLCQRNIIKVEIETTLKIWDDDHLVGERTVSSWLGASNLKDAQANLFESAAVFVRAELFSCESPPESAEPNSEMED